jgi:cob(I)alamin adenosyltransferase
MKKGQAVLKEVNLMQRGYIQIYTGDGKGKTTAALGLGLRAVGRGFRVVMIQFLKNGLSGELDAVKSFNERFQILNFSKTNKFMKDMSCGEREKLYAVTQQELGTLHRILDSDECDILILDEIFAALHAELISLQQALEIIEKKPSGMELVLTGRNVPDEIAQQADLITEMRAVRHYADKGVKARLGIEH